MISHDCHCGPGWMPKFVKRRLSKKFNECCAYHDEQYNKQEAPKHYIDDRFLDLMIDRCANVSELVVAYVFYFFVVVLGWTSWHRNKIRNRFKRS